MAARTLQNDQRGAVFVELAILLPIVVTVFFGSIDLLYLLYQWNAAAKAVEVGARIAAVSDPVAAGLNGLSDQAVLNGTPPGGTMPLFSVSCDGRLATCTCSGTCVGMAENSYSAAAMNRLIFGRGSTSCGENRSDHSAGMCDLLWSITSANVVVVYQQTGLGYAGRPGGPVPTITVSLQNMQFELFFLSPFLGKSIAMPAMTTTITAEDLCSGGGMGSCD